MRRLESASSTTTYTTYRISTQALTTSFQRVDDLIESGQVGQSVLDLADLGEGEAANSVGVLNALLDDSPDVDDDPSLRSPSLKTELGAFSEDLTLRWKGALFALNPANPDAARHFCTSAREILTRIIDTTAPDSAVETADPECDRTPNGTPSRRAKVRYLLNLRGINEQAVEDFVEADLDNVLELFLTFNKGTHGAAGKYTVRHLIAIRTGVESAIRFLHRIVI